MGLRISYYSEDQGTGKSGNSKNGLIYPTMDRPGIPVARITSTSTK